MTRNLYVGSAFNILLDISTPEEVPDRVAKVYARILSSQFQWRAEAIADEIVKIRPDVVGLQEAPLLLFQSPSEVSIANQPQPAVAAIDYLQILIDALQRRHAHYVVAAIVNNTDLTAPSTRGDTIRFIDRDVILVRTSLPLNGMLMRNPQAKNFKMQLKLPIAGNEVTIRRGWCSVDVEVGGKVARIVNTHLEEGFFDLVQFYQAQELSDGPFRTSLPVIALGDFNASDGSDTYRYLLRTGFKDSWPLTHPADPGFSCCQDEDLLNSTSQLKERIDLILHQGIQINVDDMKLVGNHPTNRIPSGQWPSDHAGVVATLSIK
jgi:endonuclease/exonuclease/phosphatase family metal-dependent hydrolase